MKRTATIAALATALVLANVRAYTNVPDPTLGYHVVTGVVLIVPSHDLCYGLELEHGTNVLSPFGGECE